MLFRSLVTIAINIVDEHLSPAPSLREFSAVELPSRLNVGYCSSVECMPVRLPSSTTQRTSYCSTRYIMRSACWAKAAESRGGAVSPSWNQRLGLTEGLPVRP